MLKTVYIDTSVICYLTDPPSSNPVTRACQLLTQQWWEQRCERSVTYVSDAVLRDIKTGNPARIARRMEIAEQLIHLPSNKRVLAFAELLILGGGLNAKARSPAEHIAIAATRELDILLTWNCVDIANARKFPELRRLMVLKDLELPELITPFELMENSYEILQY
ncbi:MAG: hypothetical protein ABW202_14405 [Duganella sp.]